MQNLTIRLFFMRKRDENPWVRPQKLLASFCGKLCKAKTPNIVSGRDEHHCASEFNPVYHEEYFFVFGYFNFGVPRTEISIQLNPAKSAG